MQVELRKKQESFRQAQEEEIKRNSELENEEGI